MRSAPIYQQVYADLKQEIHNGNFLEGDLLPSENELCQRYDTTRATIRQGLDVLVREGYIEKRHGLGSVVVDSRHSLGLLSFKGFTEVLSETVMSTRTEIIEVSKKSNWTQPFFYELSAREQRAGCVRVERLRYVEEEPLMLESTYLPDLNIPGLADDFRKGSLFQFLATSFQITVEGVEQDIRAIVADDRLSGLLSVSPGSPLLQIFRRYRTNREGFFIYSCLYCNTTRYTISNFLNR